MMPGAQDSEDSARRARALGNAKIAYFESALDPEGGETAWLWSGAQFGIAEVDGPAGRDRLVEAAVDADRPGLQRLLGPAGAAASGSYKFRLAAPDGGTVFLRCDAHLEQSADGRPRTVFGTVRDETSDRRFETAMNSIVRRNHMLLATIDTFPLSITVADITHPDAPLIYVNRKFLDLSGYEATEVIGRNCRFLQGPGTDAEVVAGMRRSIAAGEQVEVELLNYHKSGRNFLNRLILSPIHDDAGRLTAYIGLQFDATLDARRKAEEAQRQKLEALGRMMGGVAHEINNMLQPMALLVQDLIDRDLVAQPGRNHLDISLECCLKARHIIGDLLAFSRPTLRSADILDPVVLLEDSLRLVRQAVPPGIRLSVQIAGTPPPVRIDHTTFVQIMLNLATNAASAMAGNGSLEILLEEFQLGPAGDGKAARCTRLRVIDTGCGMDRTTLDQAFEPFFTTKPVGQGTGLGLPVVYGLIREVGGRISLDSEPGRGTVATILLPGDNGGLDDGVHPGH